MRQITLLLVALVGCVGGSEMDRGAGGIEGGGVENGHPEVVQVRSPTGRCTGTLIHDRVVMTAKHCVPVNANPGQVSIWSGTTPTQWEADGVDFAYVGLLEGAKVQEDDLLLVVLDRTPSVTARATPRTAGLSSSDIASKVRLIGYGGTNPNGSGGGTRKSGIATISIVEETTFHTIRNAAGEAVCRPGDSGGPVFIGGEVAGVMDVLYYAGPSYPAGVGGHRCHHARVDRYWGTIQRAIQMANSLMAVNESGEDDSGYGAEGEGEDDSGYGAEGEGEDDSGYGAEGEGDPCASYDWSAYCVTCDGYVDEGDGCCTSDPEDPEICTPPDGGGGEGEGEDLCFCDAECEYRDDCCWDC